MDNWIKVEDELPAESDDYLVAVMDKDGGAYVSISAYILREKKWSSPFSMGCGYDCDGISGRITHWARLPEYPNGN
jgi:hypothetical protein